ncbi:MAG: hypothetical protein Q4Q14_07120 [Methanobrevibacter sp.]|nr:hypothetical protein [Methanobrevibacter sp.]
MSMKKNNEIGYSNKCKGYPHYPNQCFDSKQINNLESLDKERADALKNELDDFLKKRNKQAKTSEFQ